ncbi:MAG: DUF309 domain-containing protein [Chlamydiae bacterium]|nr:DUF309 domain-containing protein [Chlamydiota bacterium]MBI3267275.1 DUF309 domain-containing protein [Chlamydiota bacterium]
MLDPMRNYPQVYLDGIQCFNEGKYFECHELLESLWLEATGIPEVFYQGLIQEAVAIYHLENKNLWGATSLFQLGLEKLAKVPDIFMGLEVRKFERDVKKFFEPYLELKEKSGISIDESRIPKIILRDH